MKHYYNRIKTLNFRIRVLPVVFFGSNLLCHGKRNESKICMIIIYVVIIWCVIWKKFNDHSTTIEWLAGNSVEEKKTHTLQNLARIYAHQRQMNERRKMSKEKNYDYKSTMLFSNDIRSWPKCHIACRQIIREMELGTCKSWMQSFWMCWCVSVCFKQSLRSMW